MQLLQYKYFHLCLFITTKFHPIVLPKPSKRLNVSFTGKNNPTYADQGKTTVLNALRHYAD